MSARTKPSETSPTVVTSVEPVPATVMVEVEAAEFVIKPELVTDWVTAFRSKPLRSNPAPALIVMALAVGIAPAMPNLRIPAVTATAPPFKELTALRVSTPAPALVSAVPLEIELVTTPLTVAVTAGLVTVIVRAEEPRSMAPENVTLLPATRPPKVKLPATVTALPMMRVVPSLKTDVPSLMVSVPVPTGPDVIEGGVPAVADPKIRLP